MAKDKYTKKLFNKGQRTIQHDRGELAPNKADTFTEEEAQYLLPMFSGELLDMDNVRVDDLVNKTDAAGQVSLSEQEDAIKVRLDRAREAKAKKAYDEAIKEGFEEKEAREIAGLKD